jgi:hypothetical protein
MMVMMIATSMPNSVPLVRVKVRSNCHRRKKSVIRNEIQ